MDIATVAQLLSAATNAVFVVIVGIGYYVMIKLYRRMVDVYDRMVRVTETEHTALGRPQVIVDDNYDRLPEVDVAVRNVGSGAAKDITFEFSARAESSDGTVISDLSYFRDGLNFLSPNGRVTCYWDNLNDLLPFLEEKGLTDGITVTTHYKDLAGEAHETEWTLNPFIYRDDRYVQDKGVEDIAGTLEEISGNLKRLLERR